MCIQEADIECASWLADAQVPFSLVFTKTDKRKKGVPKPQENMDAFQVIEGSHKLFWHHLFPLRSKATTLSGLQPPVFETVKALHGLHVCTAPS